MLKSEIRKDYLLDRYVIMTPSRGKRPHQLVSKTVVRNQDSPFTPENLKHHRLLDSIGRGPERIVAIKNIFPAVTLDNPKAYGAQEVIVETPDPSLQLADLSAAHLERLFKMYARRTKALSAYPKLEYVLCLKNEGIKSGASLHHAHSQMFASQVLPPLLKEEARLVAEYHQETGRNFYADLIKKEMKSPRKIFEDKHMAVFAPYASQYHYEAWIFSKRPVDNIARLTSLEIASAAKFLKKILVKLKDLDLSYNYFCHQVVSNRHQHFCLKIEPRDSVWGGVELGSGMVVNSVLPEKAARFYRS